jgi:hypothetical protein
VKHFTTTVLIFLRARDLKALTQLSLKINIHINFLFLFFINLTLFYSYAIIIIILPQCKRMATTKTTKKSINAIHSNRERAHEGKKKYRNGLLIKRVN